MGRGDTSTNGTEVRICHNIVTRLDHADISRTLNDPDAELLLRPER